MRSWSLLAALLLFLAVPCGAEDAIPVIPTAQGWQGMVTTVLMMVLTAFLIPWLKNKASAARAEATQIRFDASKSILEQKHYLIDARLKPFLWDTAAYLTEVRLPTWTTRILAREFDGIWGDLVKELKDLAIKKFGAEGIDIVEAIGADTLAGLVKRAVIDALPIPNGIKDPANFLAEKFLPVLVTKGVAWARERVNNGEVLALSDTARRLDESGAHVSIKPGA